MAKKGKFEKSRMSDAQRAAGRSGGKRKKKGGSAAAVAVVAVLVVLALAVFVGAYAYGSQLERGTTIYPNVRVAGVDVGGMTALRAMEEVEKAVADAYSSQTLTVRLEDRELSFDPEQTNVALDAEAAINEAMAFGRSDGPFRAMIHYLDSQNRSRDIQLETALELDTEYIRQLIAQTQTEIHKDPVNSAMTLGEDLKAITVVKGAPGRDLDTEGLYEAVYNAFQNGDFTPLEWPYEVLEYVEADLEPVHELLTSEMQDAQYDEENHEIIEGVSGHSFDLTAAQAKLASADYGQTLTIHLEELLPEINAEELNAKMFGQMLESRSSYYVYNPARTENLRLACEAINGTIVNPGEVFSFNDTVGERTEEKGYKGATIYGGDGESVDGIGGGVCQVASTIYYLTLYLNMEQVMREPHMYRVTYVPEGMDATIYWDSGLDYKFRNTLDHPLKIQANIDNGQVNITFWGVKDFDFRVEMTSKVLETWTDDPVDEVDETKPVGFREVKQTAYTGAKVEAYQKIYDANGNLIEENTILSIYKSRPLTYTVGPEPEEEEPEETPDPADPDNDIDDPWGDLEDPWWSDTDNPEEEYWP